MNAPRLFQKLLVMALALWLAGCGGGEQEGFVANGTTTTVQTFSLTVGAHPAALAQGVLPQISATVTQLRFTLYAADLRVLGSQTIPRAGSAVFSGLVPGQLLVRAEGLDAANNVVGYFDRVINFTGDQFTQIPGLRLTATPPAPALPASASRPYLLFLRVPAPATGATAFTVTGQVYSASGEPLSGVTNGVSLASSTVPFEGTVAPQATDASGVVTFSNLRFANNATGTTVFTLAARGVDSATSAPLNVSAAAPFFASNRLLSVSSAGAQGNNISGGVGTSADGRIVAFASRATNLAGPDTNGFFDIYVRDLNSNATERVSITSTGGEATGGDSLFPSVSADGRYVVYQSEANNIVPGDTNNAPDCFLFDRVNRTVTLVSSVAGVPGNSASLLPKISGDGNWIAFSSSATNLVTPSPAPFPDIFVYERASGAIRLVSMGNGVPANSASLRVDLNFDGNIIVFNSLASNLVAQDTNGQFDIFAYNRTMNSTEIVSVTATGAAASATFSAPVVSADGQLVAFGSMAANLVTGDTNGQVDVFVKNLANGSVDRVSASALGLREDGFSAIPSISADGRFVAFHSTATNLVAGDTNGFFDAFLYDRLSRRLERVSVNEQGAQATGSTFAPVLSANGLTITQSSRGLLLSTDANGFDDVYQTLNPFLR